MSGGPEIGRGRFSRAEAGGQGHVGALAARLRGGSSRFLSHHGHRLVDATEAGAAHDAHPAGDGSSDWRAPVTDPG